MQGNTSSAQVIALQALRQKFPIVFLKDHTTKYLQQALSKPAREIPQKEQINILRAAKPLRIAWNKPAQGTYMSFKKEPTVVDLLNGLDLSKGYYLSHLGAIWALATTAKLPHALYITREMPGKSGIRSSFINDENIAKAFTQPARTSNNYITYLGQIIYLLEKKDLKKTDVCQTQKKINGKQYILSHTSLERTFIDCVTAPHYSGGAKGLIANFSNSQLNIKALISTYERLDFLYPYWQSIGFLLDLFGKDEDSQAWFEYFKKASQKKLFLHHEAKKSWVFNEKWQIFYPPSL